MLSACQNQLGPSFSSLEAYFTARVEGAMSVDYQGGGSLYLGVFEDGSPQFLVLSSGFGSSTGQSFRLEGVFDGPPKPGTYSILSPEYDGSVLRPPDGAFNVYYGSRPAAFAGGESSAFSGVNGTVTISHSSTERVEGHLTFAGKGDEGSSSAGATIQVTGSFAVIPAQVDTAYSLH
jgi:hypothetical protein